VPQAVPSYKREKLSYSQGLLLLEYQNILTKACPKVNLGKDYSGAEGK